MLSRKKPHTTPTFLEGTRGTYVRRASPPPIPSLGGRDTRNLHPPPQPETSQGSFHVHNISNGSGGALSPRPPPQLAQLSSHSFSELRAPDRGRLAISQSIGNVVPLGTQENATRISSSLNNLPLRAFNSLIGNQSLVSGSTPEDELPLPSNWAVEVTDNGFRYYVDHNTKRTHWLHPLARENLPPGWKKLFDPVEGVIYFNEVDSRIHLEHPGIQKPFPEPQQMPPEPRQFAPGYTEAGAALKAESTVENLNILHQETPEWLRLYSQADPGFDHLLDWNLFSEGDLQNYSELMLKLHKQEVINLVIRYERLRKAIGREIDRRAQGIHPLMSFVQQPPP